MYELSVGSKVFLLGEYQVLMGGSALLTVLEPRFKLLISNGSGKLKGISSESPAGRMYQQENAIFKDWDLEFIDPHEGRGGFGASTAQFALLQGFKEGFESFRNESQIDFDLRKIHNNYLKLASTNSGIPPSGADLISQFNGGLIEVDFGGGKIQNHSWPFPQWQLLFFATGKKIATHEHLSELKNLEISKLRIHFNKALQAFKDGRATEFLIEFTDYQKTLAEQGWQTNETKKMLELINLKDGVIASKGCGAMGADVIAIICETHKTNSLIESIELMGLKYSGNLENRTEGFTWGLSPQNSSFEPILED